MPAPTRLQMLLPALGAFAAILLTGLVSAPFMGSAAPLLVASMGASAVLMFCLPDSPLTTPWAFVGGHFVSVVAGITCAMLVPSTALAAALAVSLSILLMQLLDCVHPPGGAAALTCVVGGPQVTGLGYKFLLLPVGLNVALMLALVWGINRLTRRLTERAPAPPA
jgi:CBS domain-containing membrane protein